ncbi:hypothetical protein OJF2_55400 [Aquisphaera giovannonii]|uniref:Uncharacterized protein n=1 Tax=Aquisphaera giovannonii TaxID=406548 RepID=A0A5B9WA37_9BACT|nr:hypothetical protein [Aquisphaera giovannonii]QEH36955.1 hypothetical protein OJF2_55400 [Aquisphaera giovannonii]
MNTSTNYSARAGLRTALGLSLAALLSTPAAAEDVIIRTPVRDLKITQGSLPAGDARRPSMPSTIPWGQEVKAEEMPYVVLEGAGEGFVDVGWPGGEPDLGRTTWPLAPVGHVYPDDVLCIRVPAADGEIRGRLTVPAEKGMASVSFAIPIRPTTAEDRHAFGVAKLSHYQLLLHQGGPGVPWFRRQIRDASTLLAEPERINVAEPRRAGRTSGSGATTLEDTFSLFGGGRAIGENLQLDRPLPLGGPDSGPMMRSEQPAANAVPPKAQVKLDSLAGINVGEMDWRAKLAGRKPTLDPLSRAIPADQHALFLGSPAAAKGLIGLLQQKAMPILGTAGLADEILPVQRRVERQLGVTLDEIAAFQARVDGDRSIRGLALTGSDPYLATGTDVAVLFDAADPSALKEFLRDRLHAACRVAGADVRVVEQDGPGCRILIARSADRSLSAYLAAWDGTVLLTNSPWQVQQVGKAVAGQVPRLADAPEYAFFRDRYPRGREEEAGLVVLTDATIRRWCGPRWRIGSSRRVRAAGWLAAIQADHLAEVVAGAVRSRPLDVTAAMAPGIDLGRVRLSGTGVSSETYGTLSNPAPIAELPLEEVTAEEAAAYGLWRDGYQRNWRRYFDPIAIRLAIRPQGSVEADLTVTPLIASSEYKPMIDLTGASRIGQGDGDPHPEAILHAIAAIDVKAVVAQTAGNEITRMTNMPAQVALGWIGNAASVYLDSDPIWKEAAAQPDPTSFLSGNLERLPIGLHVASTDGTRLALFLAGVRAFVDQSAPGLVAYETRKHGVHDYVRVSQVQGEGPAGRLAIYYAATPRALVISPSEKVVRRFFDRIDAAKAGAESKLPPGPPRPEWLGDSVALRVTPEMLQVVASAAPPGFHETLRRQSWANLPILNEYHRLFPGRDPAEVHESLWGTRPSCPGGGRYVWNDAWKTMESTSFGCPGAPRPGPGQGLLGPLEGFEDIRFGLTFEDQGLRARVAVNPKKAP